jgi:hypothetical protein
MMMRIVANRWNRFDIVSHIYICPNEMILLFRVISLPFCCYCLQYGVHEEMDGAKWYSLVDGNTCHGECCPS